MSFTLGQDCELLIGSTAVDVVKDVTIDAEAATTDVTTRANSGFKVEVPTLKSVKMSFEIVYDDADPAYIALKAAYDAREAIAMTAGDYVGNWYVTKFSRAEPLEGAVTYSVECTYAGTAGSGS